MLDLDMCAQIYYSLLQNLVLLDRTQYHPECPLKYPQVLVSEVGPRDGLQSIKRDDADRRETALDRRARRGRLARNRSRLVRAAEVAATDGRYRRGGRARVEDPGLHVAALAPNLRGAQSAFEAGAHKLTLPVSVTEAHSLANVRKTHSQMLDEVRAVVELRNQHCPNVTIEAGLSVAFGCTIAGNVSDDERSAWRRRWPNAESTRSACRTPAATRSRRRCGACSHGCSRELGAKAGGAHFHNTRGQGLANVVAALEVGVTTFDATPRRHRRLPVRARRDRQHRHRGPHLPARGDGHRHRRRYRQAGRARVRFSLTHCRASRSTGTCPTPDCRRISRRRRAPARNSPQVATGAATQSLPYAVGSSSSRTW